MQRRSFAMWTAAALWASATANAAATPGQGRWEGHAVMAGSTLPLVLDLERVADGRWTGSVTLPGRGVKGAPLADLQVDARGARFSLGAAFLSPSEPPPAATLRWRGRERASGTLTVNGVAAPLTLQRSGAAQVDRPLRSTPIDDALVGTWVGRYELGGHPRDVTLTLRRDAEGLGNGSLVIVGRRRTELALDRVRQVDAAVDLRAGSAGIGIEGRFDGASIDAQFQQGPFEAPLQLRRQEMTR